METTDDLAYPSKETKASFGRRARGAGAGMELSELFAVAPREGTAEQFADPTRTR
jgi:hypothetical protein